jgi:putative hydrolase of the HAD superfamily
MKLSFKKEEEIKTIIFDLGGVILGPVSGPFSCKIEALYGIPKEKVKKTYFKYLGDWELGKISENNFWRKFLKDLNIKTKISRLKIIYYSVIVARPEVLKIIKRLKHNYKIALLTNVSKELMQYLNKKYQLNKLFDIIVPSYKYGIAKPRLKKYLGINRKLDYSRIYEVLLEKVKIDPWQCVFIDDKKENLLPAKKLE